MPESEAELLSVYFEEVAAYQYKKNKDMQNNSSSSRVDEYTDLIIGGEEDE